MHLNTKAHHRCMLVKSKQDGSVICFWITALLPMEKKHETDILVVILDELTCDDFSIEWLESSCWDWKREDRGLSP